MNQSTHQPFNLARLAKALSTLRRRHRISANRLARILGLSRRTLARLEAGHEARSTRHEARSPEGSSHGPRVAGHGSRGIAPRTAFKLAKLFLGADATQRALDDLTRLSRTYARDSDPLYRFLDVLYHYPAFLFHRSAAETLSERSADPELVEGSKAERPRTKTVAEEFADDYRHSLDLLLRSGFGTRNLGARLRAFRMQHDLTLIETAALLDLSKSELHRLERAERSPSPRTRYKILRLLTLPALVGRGLNPAEPEGQQTIGVQAAGPVLSEAEGTRRPQRLGRVHPASPEQERGKRSRRAGNANRVYPERKRRVTPGIQPIARRASSEGSQGNPRRVSPPPAGSHPPGRPASSPARRPSPSRAGTRVAWLAAARAALAVPPPPPRPPAAGDDHDALVRLRHAWLARIGLAGSLKTKELAAALGVSPPHLLRLLRGDRRPSKKLTERLESLLGTRH